MSDGQLPPESPQDPDPTQFQNSENLSPAGEPGLAPVGASAPDQFPVDADDSQIDLPSGGQYPDDMFGEPVADEAPIALPADATAGGLADVALDYGDGTEAPLPPAAEPQPLTEFAIETDLAPSANGDMFSVGDFDDDAAPADTGGDMFSVGDLMDDEPSSNGGPAPLPAPGGDMFSIDDFDDDSTDLGGPAPLASPEPLAINPEPLAMDPEPLAMDPAPLATPEPLAMDAQPLATPEPLASEPAPLVTPEPLASPEPLAAPDAFVAPEPIIEPVAQTEQFVSPEPLAAPEPVAPTQDFAAPHGITESQADTPVSDFAFNDLTPGAPEAHASEVAAAPIAEPVAEEPFEVQHEEPDVVNPYAELPDEAAVIDPASATSTFEDADDSVPTQIVNPYAEVSNEAQVIDPAMSLSEVEPENPEADPEIFQRTDPMIAYEQEQAEAQQNTAQTEQDFFATPMPESDYGFGDGALPQTGRTESVGPPGMAPTPISGLEIAAGSKAKPAAKSKGSPKLSLGRRKKKDDSQDGDVASQPTDSAAAPVAAAMTEPFSQPLATPMAQPMAQPVASDPYAAVPPIAPEAQVPLDAGAYAAAPPMAGAPLVAEPVPEKKSKRGRKAKAPKAAKAPKQGKSTLDQIFGEAKPGEKHSIFGIKFGAPAPIPGQEPIAEQQFAAPAAHAAPEVGAEVIQSVEAEAHAGKKSKRGRKAKAPKAPKAAKAPKQGKSTLDQIFGEAKPGEKHSIFGIKFGAPAPIPGQEPFAAQAPVAEPDAFAGVAHAEPFAPLPTEPISQEQFVAPPAPEQAILPPLEPAAAAPAAPQAPVAAPAETSADYAAGFAAGQLAASAALGATPPVPEVPAAEAPAPEPELIVPEQHFEAAPAQPEVVAAPLHVDTPAAEVPAAPMPIAAEAAPDLTANPFTDAAIPAAEPPAISAVPAPPAAPAAAPAYSPAGDVGMPAAAAMTAPQYAEELPAAPVAMGAPAPYEVPEVVAPVYKLADWAPRVGAQLVDNIIIVGVAYAIIIFAGLRASGFAASLLVYLAAVTAYSATQLTYNNGQTLGKRMFKLRVVREDGKPIELGYAMYRETFAKGLLWCIPIYPLIDGTNPTRDEQNRAICDKIVKSRVVEA